MKIKYDTIYFFRYKNPVTKNLKKWDTAPLIIPLDVSAKSMLAVNLHWIPKNERALFVEFLIKFFNDKKLGNKRFKAVRLFYGILKARAPKYLIAVRRYHISRITNLTEIPKTDWPRVLGKRQYREKIKHTQSVLTRAIGYIRGSRR